MRNVLTVAALATFTLGAAMWCPVSIPAAPISALVLSFAVYGFCGWLWESTVCAMLNHGSFSNSGFLLGPCCPIYGVGALICWFALRGIEDPVTLFFAAGVLCCAVEYLVGVLLEITTHARFWDYTDMPLNIQGRVCLYGFLMFGAACVAICQWIQPALLAFCADMPVWVLRLIAVAIVALIAVDAAFSMASFRRLSASLEELRGELADRINDSLKGTSDTLLERVPTEALDSAQQVHVRGRAVNGWLVEISDAVMDALRDRVEIPSFIVDGAKGLRTVARRISISRSDLRFFDAFPHLRMLPYEGVIRATHLKERALELFRSGTPKS